MRELFLLQSSIANPSTFERSLKMGMTFTEYVSDSMGVIVIENIDFPHQYFDPLAKLWATVRKEARRKYKVDVAGAFSYDDIANKITCNFFLNYSIIEFSTTTQEEYREKFEACFSKIADGFEAVIRLFIEDGAYDEYIDLVNKANGLNVSKSNLITHGDFDRLFNVFLKDLGIRQM